MSMILGLGIMNLPHGRALIDTPALQDPKAPQFTMRQEKLLADAGCQTFGKLSQKNSIKKS